MADKGAGGPRLTKLGRYEVLNELGKGAMGIVYLAKDPVIGRMVAIKTIRTSSFGDDDSESREFRERFIREAQTAGILSHPNIVTIHDIGEDPDTQTSFIAMEYIEGRNLKSLLAEKNRFSYEQIADIIAQVAEAIDYAHRKGIIHRDIKPANIIITTDGKVKIMDFGIAKIASSNLTTTGQFLGTPNYMSPEQVSGAAVDGRSDIFSLGVVLYELLTSRKPFQGENLTAISYKIVHEEFTPPAELSPEVPPDFNAIVARAMAKDPWNRYQRGKDFALALHQLKARLEERRALVDLGSMVSAAENMPTLRLENLEKLVAEAAARQAAGGGPVKLPDVDRSDWTEDSGAGSGPRPTSPPEPGRPEPVPAAVAPPPPSRPSDSAPRAAAAPLDQPPDARTMAIPILANLAAPPEMAERSAPPAPPQPPMPPVAPPPAMPAPEPPARRDSLPAAAPQPPTQPLAAEAKAAARSPLAASARAWGAKLLDRDWKRLLRAEVNTPYFWGAAGAAAVFVLLVCGALLTRASLVARPTAPMDPAVEKETLERKRALEDAKKLFAAGNYERSLALLRQVLARSPGNQQARQYAQMAENALAGRAEETRKSEEANRILESARAAFSENKYEDAVRYADEALALDGGKIEAQQLKDQAQAKIAEAKTAEASAARKKKEEKKAAVAARRQPTAAPARARGAPTPAPTVVAVAGPATLKLHFESPISEGSVMVYVNDEKVLQKPFDFSKKVSFFKRVEGTGTVEAPIQVKSGPVSVKVWLSGKGLDAAAYTTASGQLSGGETRTLRLDYSGGKLTAQIQ
ncbi:MAG: protein kinase domain-containing protein [Acidobacteriota bacterium]